MAQSGIPQKQGSAQAKSEPSALTTAGIIPISIVPWSLEPRQVNDLQRPVFSIRVRNDAGSQIDILPSTRLWVTDYESPGRGFFAFVEGATAIVARREAVLRFQPTKIEVPNINAGVFPSRVDFSIRIKRKTLKWTAISHENCVRIGGNAGIQPVESIGIVVSPHSTIIVSRSGGYGEASIIMKDMFPVDVKLIWTNPNPEWTVLSDDGVDLLLNPERVLRQVRARTYAGIWLSPSKSTPANVIHTVGTLTAVRCQIDAGVGLSPCIGAGNRIRAVIAESAEIQMQIVTPDEPLAVSAEATIDIQAKLLNPFQYEVDLANFGNRATQIQVVGLPSESDCCIPHRALSRDPADLRTDAVGVRALKAGSAVENAFSLVAIFSPDYLQPNETVTITWRLRIDPSIKKGRYKIQPYTTATVWFSDRMGVSSKLECRIDPGANDSNLGIDVVVS